MSIQIEIIVDDAEAMARINSIIDGVENKQALHSTLADSIFDLTKEHIQRDYVPKDGPRGDFWARVVDSAQSSYDDNSATVELTETGIGLRYRGGEVTPGKSISSFTGQLTKALAIPTLSVPVSGGKQISPGRAGLLAFMRKAAGGETVGFLVEGETRTRKSDTKGGKEGTTYATPKQGGNLMYVLRTITRHTGDTGILPSDSILETQSRLAVLDFIDSFE